MLSIKKIHHHIIDLTRFCAEKMFCIRNRNLLGPYWNSIDVVAVVGIAAVCALIDMLIENHVIEFCSGVLVAVV